MQVNLEQFLADADVTEALYPGKRLVKPCKRVGDFKNHCVVLDWRDPSHLMLDVRPGLTGKKLDDKMAKKYPVCFQVPTYVKIEITNDNDDDEDEEEKGKKGKSGSGGGGKKPARKKLEDVERIASGFGDSAEGKIPEAGKIVEMVIMGKKIAEEAFEAAFAELTKQMKQAHIVTTELIAKAGDLVKRVQPPGFLKPKGDETENYKYDREKNADIGFKVTLG